MSDETRARILGLIAREGKYAVLDRPIPQGQNAYAFVATHVALDEEVFLKVAHVPEETAKVYSEARFLSRATSGSAVGVDYLVAVKDAGRLGDEFGLVATEYLSGGNLYSRLEPRPLSQGQATRFAVDLLHGVAHLHSCDLVHRDIKPANILLLDAGGRLTPKLGDFGSVAKIDPTVGSVRASKHSALYVPPEGWQEPSRYYQQSDIYQVGLVLHELINGLLPVDEESYLDQTARRELSGRHLCELDPFDRSQLVDQSIARLASRQLITMRRQEVPYLARQLRSAIKRATAPEVSNRFVNASEFVGKLLAIKVPDWREEPVGLGVYRADRWQGFDWIVEKRASKKRGPEYVVLRSPRSREKFRQFRTATSIRLAFDAVGDWRR